jgi:hypothetical protein
MITQIRAVDRNGFGGVAQEQSVRVEVKWQLLYASCEAGAANAVPLVDSAGYWAHTALILASPGNAADLVFGPTSRADCRVLAPGTEYQIPPVYPNIAGAWAVFDLAEWFFRCDTAAATIIIMYV